MSRTILFATLCLMVAEEAVDALRTSPASSSASFESQVPAKNLTVSQQLNPASDNKNFMGNSSTDNSGSTEEAYKFVEGSSANRGGESYVGGGEGDTLRQVILGGGVSGKDMVVNNSTAAAGTTTLKPGEQQPVDNTTIPVIEPEVPNEMKTTNDGILISYPSTFGGNVQIALEDPVTDTNVDHFHPLWFLRPVFKKITNAISYLSHPNNVLTPAHIFKKIRDKTLHTLRETYKRICGVDMDDGFQYKKN